MRPPTFVLRALGAAVERRLARTHRDARRVQDRLLGRILRLYRDTEVGRALGLAGVGSPEDFARRVPVTTTETYRAYWERARAENRPGIVHPRPLRYMASASGTFDGPRAVPVPDELLTAYRRFTTQAMFHAFRILDDHTILDGHVLVTAAAPVTERTDSGITIGGSSGLATLNASRLARRVFRPTPDIVALPDWKEKIDRTARQAIDLDVRALTGVPICVLPLLERLLEVAAARGRPAASAREVWPNLRLYLFSGAPLALQGERLRRLLGEGVMTYEVYSSTESPFAFQLGASGPDLLVGLETCYFELQPAGSDADHPRLRLDEARAGERYRLLATTLGGLFAYRIGDLVEVTGTAPFTLRFAGREREELRIGPGWLTSAEVAGSVAAAADESGARVRAFFVCPSDEGGRSLELCVELDGELDGDPGEAVAALARAFDARLVSANHHFAAAREGGLLEETRPVLLAPGSIDAFVRERRQFGQAKFPCLYATRTVPDELLAAAARAAG